MTSQKVGEFLQLIYLLGSTGCRSVLEIGSARGDTFLRFGMVTDRAVAVDMPGGVWGKLAYKKELLSVRDNLRERFHIEADVVLGNSREQKTIEKVRSMGPYDAVFIDGDHRYDGVKADWENYGPMARKLVAFHDIVGTGCTDSGSGSPVEVPRFWNEIRKSRNAVEFIQPGGGPPMGIGAILLQSGRRDSEQ